MSLFCDKDRYFAKRFETQEYLNMALEEKNPEKKDRIIKDCIMNLDMEIGGNKYIIRDSAKIDDLFGLSKYKTGRRLKIYKYSKLFIITLYIECLYLISKIGNDSFEEKICRKIISWKPYTEKLIESLGLKLYKED